MLIGQIEGKVGEKHQIAFPKKFREILRDELIITKGFEHYLIVVSRANWKTLLEGTEGRPFTNRNSRELQRFLLGNATNVTVDAQGRFVLPEFLRKHAYINKEIIYAGIERFVEIWDKGEWEKQQENLSKNIASIAQRLNGRDERNE